ncbi:uncharacterized protein [Dysidea avara]|uniref:uncharacterized protein isoform X2 n=1 Tax=Dysidea avara TaxID=196820 RepID=UPI00332EAAB0
MTKKMDTGVPELNPIPVVATWYHIGIDFVGPLKHKSTQGNCYILTVADYFSKFVQAFACSNKESSTVFSALFKLFMQFGLPRVITSDQGSEFNNRLDKKLMKMMKIDHRLTTPYHPQANGLVERFNQTIQNMLVKFVNEKKELWEDYLDTCVFAYNTSKHESSKYCPFAVMFGQQALLPVEIQYPKEEDIVQHLDHNDEVIEQHFIHQTKVAQIVKENILTAQKRQKQVYDRKHHNPATFKVGALVLRKDMKRKKRAGGKMDYKWQGPYKVVKSVGKGIFQILNTNDIKQTLKVHGTHMKLFYPPKKATGCISTSHDESDNSGNTSVRSGKGSISHDPSASVSDKEPCNSISQYDDNIKTDQIEEDNTSVVTHNTCTHTSKSHNPTVSIISHEPSATKSDKDPILTSQCDEDTKTKILDQMDDGNISVLLHARTSHDQSDSSSRTSISYDPSSIMSDKEPSYPSLISRWDEEDITHCKNLVRMNKEQGHNVSVAINVNCPLVYSSPKQAGGYFPEFGSFSAPALSPIYSQKLEHNEFKIKPTSDKGKRVVDMIFSPPKHIVTKRKLNFSDSPDTNSVKPLRRRRKLIKRCEEFQKNTITKPPTIAEPSVVAPMIATTTETVESKITATPNVTATMSTAVTGMINTAGANNGSIIPLTAYDQLKAIWKRKPCYVIKARFGHLAIHQGSFHNLKGNNWLNDEIVNGYLRMLVELRNDSFAVLSQTITAWVNRSKSGKSSHLLSKAINMEEKKFYYIDPLGPSRAIRGAYTGLKRFFAMTYNCVGQDNISLDKFELIQLKKGVQKPGDSFNCGVLSLKIAEQLLNFNRIDEDAILQMNMKKARIDIGTALLTNSIDMTERCIMCGRSEESFQHEDYTDRWIQCGNCNAWVHVICSGVTVDDPSAPSYEFNCIDCVKQRKDFTH